MSLAVSVPVHAQAPAAPAPAAKAGKAEDDTLTKVRKYFLTRPGNMPSRLERLIVSGGAAMAAAVGLGVGIGFGIWAYLDYQCLKDVATCNANRPADQKIEGTNFLSARANGERKSLYADMGYLAAVTFAAVSVLGVAAAFWPAGWWPFAGEEVAEPTPPTQVVTELAPPTVEAAPPTGVDPGAPPPPPQEPAPPPPQEPVPTPPESQLPAEPAPAPGGTS